MMVVDFYRRFYKGARWLYLLGTVLLYFLGVGIARYLGAGLDGSMLVLGGLWVVAYVLGIFYLDEFFSAPEPTNNPFQPSITQGMPAPGKVQLSSSAQKLLAAAALLTVTAVMTVLLIAAGRLTPVAVAILIVVGGGGLLYVLPPVRLTDTAYGELCASILIANFVPALGFVLQDGEIHRFLVMVTFPLTLLHLAMLLAFQFPDYEADMRQHRHTLLRYAGWEIGMQVHNYLLLGAFVMWGLAVFLGLPTFITLPAFLPLPLALLQVWYMTRIAAGVKPNWNALTIAAVTLFAGTAYLVLFAFWTH